MTTETREIRLKRLTMRSMRRGMKEMDILLMRYSERCLSDLTDKELDLYEALLSENDQDLYQWVSGQVTAPERFTDLIGAIARA